MTCHVTLKSAALKHIQRRNIVQFGVYNGSRKLFFNNLIDRIPPESSS